VSERQIYGWIVGLWIGVALAVVPYLLLRPAAYGRHARSGWGPTVNARLAWLLMEAPSPLGMVLLFLLGSRRDPVALTFLGLWLGHYLYRAFLFPFLLPRGARPMPVTILASGAFFNLVNSYINGRWLFSLSQPRAWEWLYGPQFVTGLLLFAVGLFMHVSADTQLRRLRRSGGYSIPRGGLFQWVSCPNYLGETIEWSGWALATGSPGGLVFALWTAANLVPRAIGHHRWYRQKFPDYPPRRRAIVPFVL
jgi:protein-S-isoprenylcysteine O-methyltransferase Ste14